MLLQLPVTQISTQLTIPIIEQKKEEPKERPLYVIKYGDNLTKIAEANGTSVERLWAANATLTDPNLIQAEKPLKIPDDAEILAERPLPEAVVIAEQATPPVTNASPQTSSETVYHPPVAGNTYEPGQCVWYIKNLRPEIPNSWGNAWEWLSNAQADGWPTGSEPRVGAVGWTSGHVVLITGVHGDMVDYTDMNGRWVAFEVGYGTAPASKYVYIY